MDEECSTHESYDSCIQSFGLNVHKILVRKSKARRPPYKHTLEGRIILKWVLMK